MVGMDEARVGMDRQTYKVTHSVYMPRGLAQQRMTLSDLEWPFHASRAISVVAELLVLVTIQL